MKNSHTEAKLVLLGAIFLVALLFLLSAMYTRRDNMEWTSYRLRHNCVPTGTTRTHWHWGGRAAAPIEEVEYRCDGGELIWRSE